MFFSGYIRILDGRNQTISELYPDFGGDEISTDITPSRFLDLWNRGKPHLLEMN